MPEYLIREKELTKIVPGGVPSEGIDCYACTLVSTLLGLALGNIITHYCEQQSHGWILCAKLSIPPTNLMISLDTLQSCKPLRQGITTIMNHASGFIIGIAQKIHENHNRTLIKYILKITLTDFSCDEKPPEVFCSVI